MGTRLYPAKCSDSDLEKLAGVRSGIADYYQILMNALDCAYEKMEIDEVDLAFYVAVEGGPIAKYRDFLSHGWGKFDLSLIPEDESIGSTKDPELCLRLLLSANADLTYDESLEILRICKEGLVWH